MKRFISTISIIVLIIATFSLSGCSNKTEPETVVLVMCNRSNFTYLSLNEENDAYKANEDVCEAIFNCISDAFYSYGKVYAISTESEPEVICVKKSDKPGVLIDNAKRRQNADNDALDFAEMYEQHCVASNEESDLLQAITVASDVLNAVSGCKKLVICDSGLSTSGYVNFVSQNLFDADIDTIIKKLEEKHALPSLSGVDAQWYGIGNVLGEQKTIPPERSYCLKELWRSILEATGAKVQIDTSPLASVSSGKLLPRVTAVPMPARSPIPDNDSFITISCEDIRFNANSAEINYYSNSIDDALNVIVESINRYSIPITLAGSTASYGDDGKKLSLERAAKIRTILIEKGAEPSLISTVGIGRTEGCPLRVDDLNEDGSLNEELAAKNRAVFIYRTDSDLARRVDDLIKGETL